MRSPLEETENWKYSDFWLNYGSLPLVELLLDKEESFLPLLRYNVVSLPVGDARYLPLFLLESAVCLA